MAETTWTAASEDHGSTVAAFVRARTGKPWNTVKEWIASGKVFVDGVRSARDGARVRAGQTVELRMAAPRRRPAGAREVKIVFEDSSVVVIDKPSGVSSVPYQAHGTVSGEAIAPTHAVEKDTAMDLVRDAWRRMGRPATSTPLHVVHRIDKETSGLLVFAKTKRAETALASQLRAHEMDRTYVCVAHGVVKAGRIESRILADRGDGLRGSARPGTPKHLGKHAVTHVSVLRVLKGATLCEVRLETGKTHQIRIHLSERGHPLVGEKVYIRDWLRHKKPVIEAPRLMLHAATLGFVHPVTGEKVTFRTDPPPDFQAVVDGLI